MPKITQLLDGIPTVSNQGQIAFCAVLLIEGEDRNGDLKRIVVDTAHGGRRLLLVDSLASIGLTTQDIDYVLCTHAHWDHMQNIDLFTQAKLLIHADERKYAHDPSVDDWATPSWTGYLIEQLQIEEVGDGHEIIPGVKIVDMIGHTVGSIGASVETSDGLALMTSDAIHLGSVVESRTNPLVFWDEKAATKTIDRVIEIADLVYPGHDAPFRILSDGSIEYQKELDFKLAGLTPEMIEVGAVLPDTMMPGRQDPDRIRQWHERGAKRIADVIARPYDQGLAPVPSKDWDFA